MPKIEINNLYKIFGHHAKGRAFTMLKEGKGKQEILKKTGCTVGINNASFTVKDREIFVVMGLSGSGKSTVIRCLNRLIEATAGSVKIDGEEITDLSPTRLREVRRKKLAMVFQRFGLLPHRSVIDNVAFGLEIQGMDREARHKDALQAIETVGLKGYEEQMTQQLSGGMQQRVGLARAIANNSEILLMDEAFSALDPLIRVQLQDELLELQAKLHKTILFITHDLDEALKIGDRIAIMKDGAVVQVGTPEEILTQPANDYVRNFVENVDRTKVITASTIMQKPHDVAYLSDGPHLAIRKLRKSGASTLFVVDKERRIRGYITIDETLTLAKKVPSAQDDQQQHTIEPIVKTDYRSVDSDAPIADMLGDAAATTIPLVVTNKDGHLEGIITRPSILAGIAGEVDND